MYIVCGAFIASILYAYSTTNFKSFENIMNQLQKIDNDLNSITKHDRVDYEAIKRFQIIVILTGLGAFLAIAAFDGYIFYG